jgi:hypothetical protein
MKYNNYWAGIPGGQEQAGTKKIFEKRRHI